jgi:hypothetical protein
MAFDRGKSQEIERSRSRQKNLIVKESSPKDFKVNPIGDFSASVNSVNAQQLFNETNSNILNFFGENEQKISSIKEEQIKVGELEKPKNIEIKEIDGNFGVVEKQKQEEKELEPKNITTKETKSISKPNSSTVISLLENNICTVDFIRVSRPQIERIMRCTVSEEFVPSNISGLGYSEGRIIVWDLDKRGYRSFYPNRVIQISYEEDVE